MEIDAALKIHLFGRLEILHRGRALPAFPTQKSTGLFAFLVLHRHRAHPREALAERLWPGRSESSSRKCLRTDLWRIRRTFREAGLEPDEVLGVTRLGVRFRPRCPVWIDTDELIAQGGGLEELDLEDTSATTGGMQLSPSLLAGLRGAVELYRGDLLPELYEPWCEEPRERLRSLLLASLFRLMQHYRAMQQWEAAITCGNKLLTHDPLQEHVHRQLMFCYWKQGNRPAALRQFNKCRELLRRELAVEPMDETSLLYAAVRADVEIGSLLSGDEALAAVRRNGAGPGGAGRAVSGDRQDQELFRQLADRIDDVKEMLRDAMQQRDR